MASVDPIGALAELINTERERIARLWSKRLRDELHEYELPSRELRRVLEHNVAELGRLLAERGEDALEMWPESVRAMGASRFDQHFEADDVARELKVLHSILLGLYAKRHKRIEPELAIFLANLMGEAIAAVEASYSRLLKTEEVRFREAALMESVLHHVHVGIVVAEPDGTLSYATPPVSRLFGIPVRAFLGARAPKTLAAVLAQVNAHHANGHPFRVGDMPFSRALQSRAPVRGVSMYIERQPRGEEALLEMTAIPLWAEDGSGELLGVIQTVTDRTENIQRTRELGKAQDELRRLQGRLLQRTRTQALGQLAANMAHSLNNFLNVLRLRITLLRREFKPEHLDALDRTVQNIGELVARLQDFQVVRTEEELATVELGSVVREALELARPELGADGAQLEHVSGTRARIRVDPATLRELLVNLLLAARDRTPSGGKLSLRTYEEDGRAILRLKDSGPTLSAEDLARLFDPLKGRGTSPHMSLMLAVARNQLHRWGGELECQTCATEDEPEAPGMEWVLRIPIVQAQDEAPAPPARERVHVQRPRHHPRLHGANLVLVVDDEPENARMLAEVLTDEGYSVKVAHSGEAALDAWRHHAFDAALLDGLMPDMSGWELARELRALSPDALLAMITGADIRGQNRNSLALVDAVFRKPIDVAGLDEFLSQEHTEAEEPAASSDKHEHLHA